jgi:hypothetical protein
VHELDLLHFSIGVQEGGGKGHEKHHSGGRTFSPRNELLRHTQSLILVGTTFAICAVPTVHTPDFLDHVLRTRHARDWREQCTAARHWGDLWGDGFVTARRQLSSVSILLCIIVRSKEACITLNICSNRHR